MKRKRITRRELMDEMEFTNDLTKLPIDCQYLKMIGQSKGINFFVSHTSSHLFRANGLKGNRDVELM